MSTNVQILGKIYCREKYYVEIFENLVGGPWPPNYTEIFILARGALWGTSTPIHLCRKFTLQQVVSE